MIYLVEDEDNIRELLVYTLQNSGFDAAGFSCGADFWREMANRAPHLVLLDIMLPGEDGLAILKKLRGNPATARLPVMMLTAKGAEYDRVLGLDMGADDYMPKPFGMMELVARVKSLLRRAETGAMPDEYRIGELFVSVPRHTVSACGVEARLTLKEFELLVFLMRNAGIVLTRDRILTAIWGYDFDGETRTVDVHIRTLRSKLGACGDMILTVRGVGYKIGGEA
ncbi:MAG: response regulator transcription factor [Clostridiales Family XIII bacterium]|jgi:two-component system alkaline phosphatase synthesis response regulator PhoP|nr:response regulator transcription factor [Clostridiales Family XIII bacterium]